MTIVRVDSRNLNSVSEPGLFCEKISETGLFYEKTFGINFENVQMIAQETSDRRRLKGEALLIHQLSPSMNRDVGLEIPIVYCGIARGERKGVL